MEGVTRWAFSNAMHDFVEGLLSNPSGTGIDDTLSGIGYGRKGLIRSLLNSGAVAKKNSICDDEGSCQYRFSYTLNPSGYRKFIENEYAKYKNGMKKSKKVYFTEEQVMMLVGNEAKRIIGECGEGAAAGGEVGAEPGGAASTNTVGDYQYTVPFPGDKETLMRRPGFSVQRIGKKKKKKDKI